MIARGLWGAFLGLVCLLLWPLAFVAVAVLAIRGRYPWFLVTPDDPVSPFGQYEATVRAIYARFGRYLGDLYWLGLRNSLYGLKYALKPRMFKGMLNYERLLDSYRGGRVQTFVVAGYPLWVIGLGRFEFIAGWMVRGAYLDPITPRRPVNMEFRPVFSLRRAG